MARIKVKEEDEFSIEQAAKKVRGDDQARPRKKRNKQQTHLPTLNQVVGFAVLAVILLLVSAAVGLKHQNQILWERLDLAHSDPQKLVERQNSKLVRDIAMLTELPTDETPTIATVTDVSQARQQSDFFNNAQNGDKVVEFVKAKLVILYRPSTNTIIGIN